MLELSINGKYWSNMAMVAFSSVILVPLSAGAREIKSSSNVASLSQFAAFSTKAKDLSPPAVELGTYFTNLETRTYQLGQLDLEKFCQDYPDSSGCPDNPPSESDVPSVPSESNPSLENNIPLENTVPSESNPSLEDNIPSLEGTPPSELNVPSEDNIPSQSHPSLEDNIPSPESDPPPELNVPSEDNIPSQSSPSLEDNIPFPESDPPSELNVPLESDSPNLESDPSSIPVPVPPPAPPEEKSSSDRQQKSGWAIVPEISTLGLGGHIVRRITPSLNARVGVNAFGLGFDIEADGSDLVDVVDEDISANYDVDLSLFNVSTIADFHPVKNSGFKLSAGLIFNDNQIEGTATTEDSIEIGGFEFDASDLGSVDVDVDITRSVAPYLGIGWGNAVAARKGLGFWFNLGVMFGGSPDIEIVPNINDNVPQETIDEIDEAVAQEEEDLQDEIDIISVYPVVSLGISFQF